MVVTCEKCQTKFNLDDRRISGARVQARCSRCQNVFWVEGERENQVAEPQVREEILPRLRPAEEDETFDLDKLEKEFEPELATAKTKLPKPSILFTAPKERSSWLWIVPLIAGFLSGVLLGGVIMWFGGYNWVAKNLQAKAQAPASQAKVAEPAKVVAIPPPAAPPMASGDVKDLEINGQQERYRGLVNTKGGQLLLIQGNVKNSSTQPRGPIKIKAMLTDPQQKTVKEREFYAGTVVFDDELQSLDPQEIDRWLDTPGGRAQKQILEPGESQSFMVVFFGAPKNLSGYGYNMQVVKGPVVPSQASRK
ncbi:MAG: DUF3426 domain-containing protein [Deltaproteobacteria bacterium]|nr:MAG: DUF3426 domain-containing protein [Deltaproteobacteria bacterium]